LDLDNQKKDKITTESAFTVDVEDGISIAMRDAFSVETEQTDRVVGLTTDILNLLSEKEVKGTFFVLGQVAEVFPDLVKDIATRGHELGVHGYNHLQFFRMPPEQAFEELSTAKKRIEDLTGSRVYGHRAPAFSITPETEWGLDVIANAGFTYDSSIMPIKGSRYGWPGFPKDIHVVRTPNGSELVEVPLSVYPVFGKDVPVCGGGYLRLFPYQFTRRVFDKIRTKRPVIIYMHPYELDTERYPGYYFQEMSKAGILKQIKMRSMWVNRKTIRPKLSALLDRGSFDTMHNLVNKAVPGQTEKY